MTERVTVIAAFLQTAGWGAAEVSPLAGDASLRRYLRLRRPSGEASVLMDAQPGDPAALRSFVTIADHLRDIGLSAPKVYARDDMAGLLLLEDFGDALFVDLMAADPGREATLYHLAADVLVHLQNAPTPDLPVCDAAWFTSALAPLFDWYAPQTPVAERAKTLTLMAPLGQNAAAAADVMILRDYHVQNLILLDDRQGVASAGLLDFQDAMVGHPAYDLVSILQDARRDVSAEIQADVLDAFTLKGGHDPVAFKRIYAACGLQRNLRILGIFARLCLQDGKPQYVDFIPRVWRYVEENLAHPALAELQGQLQAILPQPTPEFLQHLKDQCPTPPTPP